MKSARRQAFLRSRSSPDGPYDYISSRLKLHVQSVRLSSARTSAGKPNARMHAQTEANRQSTPIRKRTATTPPGR
jgi:hypothetical protein